MHTPAPVSTKIFCASLRSRSTWSSCVTSVRRLRRGGSDMRLIIIFHSVRLSSSSGSSVSGGTSARRMARGSDPRDIWRYTKAIGPNTHTCIHAVLTTIIIIIIINHQSSIIIINHHHHHQSSIISIIINHQSSIIIINHHHHHQSSIIIIIINHQSSASSSIIIIIINHHHHHHSSSIIIIINHHHHHHQSSSV